MADRLRAEAEEELTVLRTAHKDTERELTAAQQRQQEADIQLAALRAELKESRQKLAELSQSQGRTEARASCHEPERPNGESNKSEKKEGGHRGRERGVYRLESRSQNEVLKNVDEDVKTDCKGVVKRYLRNVASEDRGGEGVRPNETRRTATAERSR